MLATPRSHAVPPKVVALQMNFPDYLTVTLAGASFPGGQGHTLHGLPQPPETEQNTEHLIPPESQTDHTAPTPCGLRVLVTCGLHSQ